MESLNGYTVEQVKNAISKQTKYSIDKIRLFGSRIKGNFTEESDLDIVIKDENKIDYGLFYTSFCGINCEIRFIEDFNMSWLKYSV